MLTVQKAVLIALCTINLSLIAVFTMFGKSRITIALAVLNTFLITSEGMIN